MGENGDGHNVVNGHNDPTQTLTRCHIKGNKALNGKSKSCEQSAML